MLSRFPLIPQGHGQTDRQICYINKRDKNVSACKMAKMREVRLTIKKLNKILHLVKDLTKT